ncbi:hypothetical protein SAMN05443550_108205 [Pedobacter hartonius]|uniref:Uncharacterized protein n=1 Tax=Pedobacter hartonius TaxID=425514 RepID=A0A1H4FY90_9SPHI|nr:hypothetical protein SAMN05443550_108205 [Pedobacter hartonius]
MKANDEPVKPAQVVQGFIVDKNTKEENLNKY